MPLIRGVFSCWGALRMPAVNPFSEEAAFFKDNVLSAGASPFNAPVISFHGRLDGTNPYLDDASQDFLNSQIPPYNSENFCFYQNGTYQIKMQNVLPLTRQFTKKGSGLTVYNILKDSRINRFTEFYGDCDAKHGLTGEVTNPNRYKSDYGTGYITDAAVTSYIAGRIAVFCQKIMNYSNAGRIHPSFRYLKDGTNDARSYFINCKNNRQCSDNVDLNNCPVTPDFDINCDPINL